MVQVRGGVKAFKGMRPIYVYWKVWKAFLEEASRHGLTATAFLTLLLASWRVVKSKAVDSSGDKPPLCFTSPTKE